MTPPEEAQQLIEEHIATLDEHKASLERALSHLNGTAPDNAQQRGGQQRPGQGGRGQRRGGGQGRGQRQEAGETQAGGNGGAGPQPQRGAGREKVIADLEANPGSKAAEIAGRVGISATHANTILGNLVKQGRATKEGPQYTLAGA